MSARDDLKQTLEKILEKRIVDLDNKEREENERQENNSEAEE